MKPMNIVDFQYRTVSLTAKVLNCIPEGLTLDEGGPWLERAFWLSQLHYHLLKVLSHDKAFGYVNYLLTQKRRVNIDPEIYALLLEAGHKPAFARWWRKLISSSGYHFVHQASMFREYLPPDEWQIA